MKPNSRPQVQEHSGQHFNSDSAREGDDLEGAIEEALGDEPRAAELRRMRAALLERRRRIMADLQVSEDEAARQGLRRELAKLNEHISVLSEEAQITAFVEDAVRVGVEMRKLEN